jgi:hypothetical protein
MENDVLVSFGTFSKLEHKFIGMTYKNIIW